MNGRRASISLGAPTGLVGLPGCLHAFLERVDSLTGVEAARVLIRVRLMAEGALQVTALSFVEYLRPLFVQCALR